MYEAKATIVNPTGLHARPAAEFVGKAKEFHSKIAVHRKGETESFNAKSIIMLMSGAFVKGDEVIIEATGEDEQSAADTLKALINSGFGEL